MSKSYLVKDADLRPSPPGVDSTALWYDPGICIYINTPGDSDAVVPRATI